MADTMRSEGKIYVVVLIFLLILLALFYYMFRIEKKIDKIEQNKK
jgi:cbb3-type cytochrome oxidase subunit 3